MPLLSTERKSYSDVVAAVGPFENVAGVDYNFARANCEGAAAIEPMGVPMVWVVADDAFVPYLAQTIPTAVSSLPDGSPVCLVVGEKIGKGVNKQDITLTATSQELTTLFRGPAAVVNEGITWGAVSAPNQALFLTALEKQSIAVVSSADLAAPAYV